MATKTQAKKAPKKAAKKRGGKPHDEKLIAQFGKNLHGRREELGLSQEQLAAKVGCSRVNISNIEVGKQGVSLVMFVVLCAELGCTPDAMLKGAC